MKKQSDFISEDISTYGPLNPEKWMFYRNRVQKFLDNRNNEIIPVTVHFVPTLRCNHLCYFCTYGGAKSNPKNLNEKMNSSGERLPQRKMPKDMPLDLMIATLNQLSDIGVNGIIFTGGGEPTIYPHLIDGAKFCKEKGLNFSLNTNGYYLSDELVDNLLPLNPEYIRISLNAGSGEVQKLTTGVDDFERIIANIEKLVRKKAFFKARTDISVGFVVNIVNVYDIVPITQRLIELEEKLKKDGIENTIYSIQFRPVSNYENSKQYNMKHINKIIDFLEKRSGKEDVDEFRRFMFDDEQCSSRILDLALTIITKQVTSLVKESGSKIRIVYPYRKFIDIPRLKEKPYPICNVLPWFLFIWPDGTLYSCVEWAGTPGFEIGNLTESPLQEILLGENRQNKINWINEEVLHTRCAPTCAHHEMNISMQQNNHVDIDSLLKKINEIDKPSHIDFL